jgi:hypothetical protein
MLIRKSADSKHLKRKQTMPVNPSTGHSANIHVLNNVLHTSLPNNDRHFIDSNRLQSNSSQAYGTSGDSNIANPGSFLPDIYMTTTANGKVTMVSGSKQVAS